MACMEKVHYIIGSPPRSCGGEGGGGSILSEKVIQVMTRDHH